MPSFKLPAISIPGLREMSTDDIRNAVSDIRVPEVKLSDLDPRKADLPRLDLSQVDIDLSRAGIESAIASAAATASEHNPLRRRRPSRWPKVIAGLVIAAVAILVVRNASWIRDRAREAAQRLRERADADRIDGSLEPVGMDDNGYATDVAIPIESDPYSDSLPSAAPEIPTAGQELADALSERVVGEDAISAETEHHQPSR